MTKVQVARCDVGGTMRPRSSTAELVPGRRGMPDLVVLVEPMLD